MIEKSISGGICHTISQYIKTNNKYMKDYDKNKQSSYLKYWGVNNLYGWVMLQNLSKIVLNGSKKDLNLRKN